MRKSVRKGIILLLWIAVWQLLSFAVDNSILLAGPAETVSVLRGMLGEHSFYLTVAGTLLRIAVGFLLGFLVAVLLAAVSSRFAWVEEMLSPFMNLIKTIPVASFVVLLLIWWGSSFLSVAISFLVVLPNIYINTLEGLKNADGQLLEMAKVFGLPLWNRFFYIYRPALKPFLCSGLKISLGMCWKSGVAAEVIGTPDYSIGERLYLSKVYLDTAELFGWTAVIVLLCVFFEKVVLWLTERFFGWEPTCRKCRKEDRWNPAYIPLGLCNVTKSYGDQVVLDDVSVAYEPGKTYYLTSPSGSGKTTLFRILAGLTSVDSGRVETPPRCSVMFQEDRLCEEYSAVKNVELVLGNREQARKALQHLLEPEALEKPCRELSGGMKRRVALVRAMEAESDFVLLDEPFTGMDTKTRHRAEEYIRSRQRGRTLIIATHI